MPFLLLLAVALFNFMGCTDTKTTVVTEPTAEIMGDITVPVERTLQLTAVTLNGTDATYIWGSTNPSVATVDQTGLVTGVAQGETVITVTGVDTGAMGTHAMVVGSKATVIPNEVLWSASGHADTHAEAFNHWNEEGEIPTSCAKCHSDYGYRDFLGADGTTAGVVDNPAPVGSVITCETCHNAAAIDLSSVTFPSGTVIDKLGSEARCMVCHQGRESGVSVEAAITKAEPETPDTVTSGLRFINVHYLAAGATLYGTQVNGGFQYPDKDYNGKFPHVTQFDTCVSCHSPHSLDIEIKGCRECHTEAYEASDIRNVRMARSYLDYDGDGNTTEGMYYEVEGVRAKLYGAIQEYAHQVVGVDIVYDPNSYPYFFADDNGNGVIDEGEGSYSSWTPRLLEAAYNYQFSTKDLGAFAHNDKYIIELCYDSINDLAQAATIDQTGMVRNDMGHFDPTSEAYRHWDGEGEVEAACTRCHSSPEGFDYYLDNGFTNSPNPLPITWGMTCETCHTGTDFGGDAPRKYVAKVIFPGGKTVDNDPESPDDSFICMTCHQGRESKATIDAAIAAGNISFRNVHYLPAGATLYGTLAQVGYEYPDKTYVGKFQHWGYESAQCAFCHQIDRDKHSFNAVLREDCLGCHTEVVDDNIETIRKNRPLDYDGDGDTTEELKVEIQDLATLLYQQMQAVGTANGTPLVYDPNSYPYFFNDTNGDGIAEPDEVNFGNRFTAWTAPLVKAAQNFQFSQKEPGAWAHNTKYMAELLIDSIGDLGGDVSNLNRP